ncbi:MAG: peptide-methionine (S)-S-oxide reductase MsrA [Rhodospirillales bacterium]|nr:peptide-methionine (S)-S-oxide reductase MsrA [Rhodospirillales bacterium]MCB9996360.1 peptide-methionine (S)-S-oxide reductase MsrA [Rhodospirillales bacterium]
MTEQTAIFAAGCFWGVEHEFRQVPGVIDATSGYTGGHKDNPTYKEVCTGATGHAEAVKVVFDPARVSYDDLLSVFWRIHNPTCLNRQGPDVGTQYRSAIFYTDETQREAAQKSAKALQDSGQYDKDIVTEITAASTFWDAEEYHQRYFEKNGVGACAIHT